MTGRTLQPKVASPHDSPTYRLGGHLVTCIAGAADTNGAYSLFETHTAPGQATQLYCQQYEDETFWVLEGLYTFTVSGEHLRLTTGSYLYVPRRTVHGWTNSGDGAARMLVLTMPGGIRERFVAEAGEPTVDRDASGGADTPTAFSRLLTITRKYGIDILPAGTATDQQR